MLHRSDRSQKQVTVSNRNWH
ncbi:hypothetical protein FAGKG844_440026 [Frankia sp. AgKG'84/4]